MGRALSWLVTLAALAALAGAASAQSPTILRDVRVGAHPGYDRVVIELDGPAEIAWERGPEPGAESFYLSADPIRSRVVKTKLARVGDIAVTPMRGGTRVLLEPRERRVRAYLLAKPPRLVIDVAPPGEGEFKAPTGVQALAPAIAVAVTPPQAEPEPEPAPQAEPAPEPAPPAETKPEPETTPPQAQTAPEAVPEPAPQPEPEAAAPPAPEPQPEPAPAPPPTPAPETEALPGESFPWALLMAVLLGGAGLGALALVARARGSRRLAATAPSPADRSTHNGVDHTPDFSDEDVRRAADAASVLEQRLDDEVRARVALEERLAQAGEELKVLRDRLHRVERRSE